MIAKNCMAFADTDGALPYNINTIATIKTDGEPVYSKSYPHPMGVTEFVNAEVKQLLANPDNNPTWVVDKRGLDQNGVKKKRLVIDFRKLNQKTVDDKYPIPSIWTILSNMGESKYFSTLDLKAGFPNRVSRERPRKNSFLDHSGSRTPQVFFKEL